MSEQEPSKNFTPAPVSKEGEPLPPEVTIELLKSSGGGGGFGRSSKPKEPIKPDKFWLAGEAIHRRVREHPEEFPENTPEELASWVKRFKAK